MYMIMLLMTILFSLLFFYSTNPFSLGLILISQTIMISLLMGNLSKSFWFLYLLILIFIGGMLVLFIYVTTIFPNEKFKINQKIFFYTLFIMIMMIIFMIIMNYMFNLNLPLNKLFINFTSTNENFQLKSSLKMFLSQSNIMIILMVNYLFYCMIVVIKIVNFFKGPLRKMNYV